MTKFLITKSVDGSFNIGINYYEPDLEENEEITAVEAATFPDDPGNDLDLGAPEITPDKNGVYVLIKAGREGGKYLVLFKVTTSTGKVFNNPRFDGIMVHVIPKPAI